MLKAAPTGIGMTTKVFYACTMGPTPTVGSTWNHLLRNCGTFQTFAT